jgi:hypothetical protein
MYYLRKILFGLLKETLSQQTDDGEEISDADRPVMKTSVHA